MLCEICTSKHNNDVDNFSNVDIIEIPTCLIKKEFLQLTIFFKLTSGLIWGSTILSHKTKS